MNKINLFFALFFTVSSFATKPQSSLDTLADAALHQTREHLMVKIFIGYILADITLNPLAAQPDKFNYQKALEYLKELQKISFRDLTIISSQWLAKAKGKISENEKNKLIYAAKKIHEGYPHENAPNFESYTIEQLKGAIYFYTAKILETSKPKELTYDPQNPSNSDFLHWF